MNDLEAKKKNSLLSSMRVFSDLVLKPMLPQAQNTARTVVICNMGLEVISKSLNDFKE